MKKRVILALMIAISFAGSVLFAEENLSSTRRAVDYSIRDSVDNSGNLYISYWGQLPSVMTFVNSDGSVTVCTSDASAETTYVYEYNASLAEQKVLHFQNERVQLGAFTKDGEGNYYFFYAEDVNEGVFDQENMALVKYNSRAEKTGAFYLAAQTYDEKWARGYSGVKWPFRAGACRLEISGDRIAVYFARQMFKAPDGKNHQASYGFFLDKNTLERIRDMQMPSVGHSFNQFILPIEDGFVFADHGDASPTRNFAFAKRTSEQNKKLSSFVFPGGSGQNATYAEMGSLAKTPTGYIFCGAYGREQSRPRNLFVLTFDENMTKCSSPIYLTKYAKENGHAGHPKIVAINDDRYLLLWERFQFSTQPANNVGWGPTGYLATYMLIINEKGEAVSEPKELEGIRLNMNDVLRYNPHNGKVYWAINDSGQSITVYALDVGE